MQDLNQNLWAPYGEADKRLFTAVPNPFIKDLVSGAFSVAEVRVLMYVARLTFGFKREVTHHLDLNDFSKELDMPPSHLSRTIKSLVLKQYLIRHSRNRKAYKYSINLLRYGIRMKHYQIVHVYDEIGNEDYLINIEDYQIYNLDKSKIYLIEYFPRGYKSTDSDYRNIDINTHRNINKNASSRTSALEGASTPSSESTFYKRKFSTVDDVFKEYSLNQYEKGYLEEFDKEFSKNKSVMVYLRTYEKLQHIEREKGNGFTIMMVYFSAKYIYPYQDDELSTYAPEVACKNNRYLENALSVRSSMEYQKSEDKINFDGDKYLITQGFHMPYQNSSNS